MAETREHMKVIGKDGTRSARLTALRAIASSRPKPTARIRATKLISWPVRLRDFVKLSVSADEALKCEQQETGQKG